MTFKEQLAQDMKAAMKQKAHTQLSTIRLIRTGIKNREIDLGKELEDDDVLKVIVSLMKQHKDSIEQFQQGGRIDLVEKEQAELAVLEAYLPQQLSEEEIRTIIREAIEAVQATSLKDMGKVMKYVMPRMQGRADGRMINQLVKEKLSK
jgi:uncharacterized protein YqeY